MSRSEQSRSVEHGEQRVGGRVVAGCGAGRGDSSDGLRSAHVAEEPAQRQIDRPIVGALDLDMCLLLHPKSVEEHQPKQPDCSDLLRANPLSARPIRAQVGTITTSEQPALFRRRNNAGSGAPPSGTAGQEWCAPMGRSNDVDPCGARNPRLDYGRRRGEESAPDLLTPRQTECSRRRSGGRPLFSWTRRTT